MAVDLARDFDRPLATALDRALAHGCSLAFKFALKAAENGVRAFTIGR
jgi:hypothetical protein